MKFLSAIAVGTYVVLALTGPSSAATLAPVGFEQLVAESAVIVRAEVLNVHSQWRDADEGSPIVTRVVLRVLQALKGAPGPQLELELLGGTVGDRTLTISDMPTFVVGEQAFLFLAPGRSISPLVGFSAGRWPIRRDAFTGREYVTTPSGTPLSNPSDVGRRSTSLSGLRPRGAVAMSPDETAVAIRRQVSASR